MQLYTEQDFAATRKTLNHRLIALAGLLAATIGVTALFLTTRSRLGTIVTMVVGLWLSYAFLMIKLMPWFRYWRYQVDIREGLSRETDGVFVSCADSLRESDGVAFHEFIIRVGDTEEDERLFFWDDDKTLPPLTEGQEVHIRSFGNYITELVPR